MPPIIPCRHQLSMIPCDTLAPGPVEPVEGACGYLDVELGAIRHQRRAKAVEHFERQSARIGGALHHDRRHRTDQHRLGHAPATAVFRHVARHFAATRGVADVDRALQIEMCHERCDVCSVGIHLVAVEGLRRAPVAAPVVRDHAEAPGEEEHQLRVPVVRAQRPAVMEDQRHAAAPVLVENFDAFSGLEIGMGCLLRNRLVRCRSRADVHRSRQRHRP